MIVVDTGPLVAGAITNDRDHSRSVELFARARQQRRRLIVSPFVVGEACYMLNREGGSQVESSFLRSFLSGGTFALETLLPEDLDPIAQLVSEYADLSLGAADASVVALAERLHITDVATIDARHFRVVRPRHVAALTLLPADAMP